MTKMDGVGGREHLEAKWRPMNTTTPASVNEIAPSSPSNATRPSNATHRLPFRVRQASQRNFSDANAPQLDRSKTNGSKALLGPFSRAALLGVVRTSPLTLLLLPLLVLGLCSGMGIFGVLEAAEQSIVVQKGVARDLVTDAARLIELQMAQAFSPVTTLEILIQKERLWPAVQRDFVWVAERLLPKVPAGNLANLQLAPGLVVRAIYLLTGSEVAIGHDLLADPERRLDSLRSVAARSLTLSGPYRLLQGGFGVVLRHPVFIPDVEPGETFGANVSAAECPPELCYLPASRSKLWGFAQGLARLDDLIQGSDARLARLQQFGPWSLTRTLDNGTVVLLSSSSDRHSSAHFIGVDVMLPNAVWRLSLGRSGGWVPVWKAGLLVLVAVGSCLVSAMLFCMLVSRARYRELLQAMFPAKALRLLQQGRNFSEEFDCVSILFSDIVAYTTISSALKPIEVAEMLNELYCEFDALVDRYGVYKVETIGDAFMCVGGCPEAEAPEAAAERVALMALDLVRTAATFRSSKGHCLRIRVGIASGPAAAAVIGRKMPRYCLFGDTVNVASRMESSSESMRIQVAAATALLLRGCASASAFHLLPRGPVEVKGKGMMETAWLAGGCRPITDTSGASDDASYCLGPVSISNAATSGWQLSDGSPSVLGMSSCCLSTVGSRITSLTHPGGGVNRGYSGSSHARYVAPSEPPAHVAAVAVALAGRGVAEAAATSASVAVASSAAASHRNGKGSGYSAVAATTDTSAAALAAESPSPLLRSGSPCVTGSADLDARWASSHLLKLSHQDLAVQALGPPSESGGGPHSGPGSLHRNKDLHSGPGSIRYSSCAQGPPALRTLAGAVPGGVGGDGGGGRGGGGPGEAASPDLAIAAIVGGGGLKTAMGANNGGARLIERPPGWPPSPSWVGRSPLVCGGGEAPAAAAVYTGSGCGGGQRKSESPMSGSEWGGEGNGAGAVVGPGVGEVLSPHAGRPNPVQSRAPRSLQPQQATEDAVPAVAVKQ